MGIQGGPGATETDRGRALVSALRAVAGQKEVMGAFLGGQSADWDIAHDRPDIWKPAFDAAPSL